MKILYYHMKLNSQMYRWQDENITDELSHHDVIVDTLNPLDYESTYVANQELIKLIKSKQYDLFMTCHSEDLLFFDTLKYIESEGVPTLLICFDNLLIPFEHKKICQYFDLVWLMSLDNKEMFERWGAHVIFRPYAANPFFYSYTKVDETNRICFVGTPYGSRVNTINCLTSDLFGINGFSCLFSLLIFEID